MSNDKPVRPYSRFRISVPEIHWVTRSIRAESIEAAFQEAAGNPYGHLMCLKTSAIVPASEMAWKGEHLDRRTRSQYSYDGTSATFLGVAEAHQMPDGLPLAARAERPQTRQRQADDGSGCLFDTGEPAATIE